MLNGLIANPIPWLLEEENPSVRYFTLIDILGASPRDPRVRTAEKAIMEKGIVPKILAGQKKGGYWEKAEDFYIRTKYKGMVWSLIRLGFLDDPGVKKGIDWLTTYARFDDGIDQAPRGWPYDKREPCLGPAFSP